MSIAQNLIRATFVVLLISSLIVSICQRGIAADIMELPARAEDISPKQVGDRAPSLDVRNTLVLEDAPRETGHYGVVPIVGENRVVTQLATRAPHGGHTWENHHCIAGPLVRRDDRATYLLQPHACGRELFQRSILKWDHAQPREATAGLLLETDKIAHWRHDESEFLGSSELDQVAASHTAIHWEEVVPD